MPADRDQFAALAELDPAFTAALAKWGTPEPIPGPGRLEHPSRYAALTRSIMGQQLSVKAARTIHGRVVELIGGHPTPELMLAQTEEALRAAGLSGAKIRAVHGIARAVQAGDIDLNALDHLPEEEAEAALVALPGVGPWTAHMFLMFVLGHPDVVAPGDVGVQNGLAVIFGLDPRPTPKEIVAMAEAWRPHRTAACRLAWHVLDATPIDDYVPGREAPTA
ncbi:MAG: DNA-3-methyladenine glycosylase 2 family protein [Solirubrobacteraceae bacterium]|nr:DNA-3-methyladenine glycosylase 2 family protein [Solirubrobacteraceae bacterium]